MMICIRIHNILRVRIHAYAYSYSHIHLNLETVPIYKERLPLLAETIHSRHTLPTNTHKAQEIFQLKADILFCHLNWFHFWRQAKGDGKVGSLRRAGEW